MRSVLWGVLCVAGLWGWVLCTIGFILCGFRVRNRFSGREALPWGGALIAFFTLWLIAMTKA